MLWRNGWMAQHTICYAGIGFGLGDIVLDGNPAPQRCTAPTFSVHVCCGQTAGSIKMPLGMQVGLGPGTLCKMGIQLPPTRGTAPNKFSAHVYCGQTAGSIKMRLGTEVGLGSGHIVLMGTQLPLPKKAHSSRVFGHSTAMWPNWSK